MSVKTLQGSRFRRITKGVYVAATTDVSHYIRGIMFALPPRTIATGVTGFQLLGVAVGSQGPMTFATTHPWPVRRRDVKVMRLKQSPPHRNGVAAPEHCWLRAASTLNLLDLVTAGDWLIRLGRTTLARSTRRCRDIASRGGRGPCRGEIGTGTRGLPTRDLAAALLGAGRAADMQSCHRG